jgi:hypothetical protein
MWPFKKEQQPNKLCFVMTQEGLEDFIKSLLSSLTKVVNLTSVETQVSFLRNANIFRAQESILRWLITPERRERMLIELYCTCSDYNEENETIAWKADPLCPIHGVNGLTED